MEPLISETRSADHQGGWSVAGQGHHPNLVDHGTSLSHGDPLTLNSSKHGSHTLDGVFNLMTPRAFMGGLFLFLTGCAGWGGYGANNGGFGGYPGYGYPAYGYPGYAYGYPSYGYGYSTYYGSGAPRYRQPPESETQKNLNTLYDHRNEIQRLPPQQQKAVIREANKLLQQRQREMHQNGHR